MGKCQVCQTETTKKCPTCLEKLKVDAYFCEACFKGAWPTHRIKHKEFNPFPTYPFAGVLRPVYPLSETRAVPDRIPRPDYAATGQPISEMKLRNSSQIEILKPADIERMRTISREVLEEGKKAARVGVTTDEIDRVVHEACVERDSYPSPLNYFNFPKSCCTSLNEVICHGIPDRYELKDGDILNLDISVFHDGFHGDLNETLCIGNVDPAGVALVDATRECLQKAIEFVKPGNLYRDIGNVIQKVADAHKLSVVRTYCGHGIGRHFHSAPSVPHYANNKAVGVMRPGHVARKLVEVTYECLMLGIEQARPGNHMGDVAHAIQQHAEKHRYGVVRDFCGHGLGLLFHDAPEVVHVGRPGTGPELKPGMMFTIEPMINEGVWRDVQWPDNWTVTTTDGKRSAQFEETLLVTDAGVEVLTAAIA
ncbi:Methionine aminopeptidase 1 [Cladochytrium tenue]|nr:Methionine aminopeptidase 1 [Cladochytrium tenue]